MDNYDVCKEKYISYLASVGGSLVLNCLYYQYAHDPPPQRYMVGDTLAMLRAVQSGREFKPKLGYLVSFISNHHKLLAPLYPTIKSYRNRS